MILGVDYASVDENDRPNLAAAKAAGLRFAIVRGDYSTWQDPSAARDRDAIRAAGLAFGAYMFPVMDVDAPSPEDQVAAFVAGAKLQPGGDFAPILDLEYPRGVGATRRSLDELADWIGRALTALDAKTGAQSLVYSSARVLDGADEDCLRGHASKHLVGRPLWLARYRYGRNAPAHVAPGAVDRLQRPPVPASLGGDPDGWWIHQYEGDAVRFRGFSSTVDCDRFNVLELGARGTRVRWLQERVGASIDGVFDDTTRDCVVRYQEDHGLVPDGVVGPRTFAALTWR